MTVLNAFSCLVAVAAALPAEKELSLSIDPTVVTNRVDLKVYGHFLEHIYHSVNGGLWGELIWNRSFEEFEGSGLWSVSGDRLVQKSPAENVRLLFGNLEWSDYEFSLEARKLEGREGFLIIFRAKNKDEFYWYNLGGWGNKRHALEKGVKGRRWGVVSPSLPGRIETGKWYRIRVRCEGARFRVWLDDHLLLDFTDRRAPHLKGRVGVGTWLTKAEYRNLTVTDLKDAVLFRGLPDLEKRRSVAKWWNAFGEGRFRVTGREPLNSEFSQEIESDGEEETGMRQKPLCVRKGEKYRGSLWVRGSVRGGISVRLRDGAKVLAEHAFGVDDEKWRRVSFALDPKADAPDAAVEIAVRGPGRVRVDQVSLTAESSLDGGGFRPDLLKAVEELRPPVIRWPGGCFAEWYRWKSGIGPQEKRIKYPIKIWDDQDVNSFGTDEFIRLCRRVGAEPLIVINIGSHDDPSKRRQYLREACEWVEYCNGPPDSTWGAVRARNGHREPYRVKYWEIDNETWRMGVEKYAEAVREFVPTLKAVDPTIKIAVCGSGGFNLRWNRKIIESAAEYMDYLSIHHYENPNRFAEGPLNYEEFFRKTAELIRRSRNPKIKIYVSEWNAQSTDWRTGLYAAGLLNAFERCGDVLGMAAPALFLRHVSAAAWDNAFINFNQCGWFPAPNYVIMKLWRDGYAPVRIAVIGDPRPLNVVAVRSLQGNTVRFKAVNPTRSTVAVTLNFTGGFNASGADFKLVAPGSLSARNTLEDPDAVRAERGEIELLRRKARFRLPPLSAGVVTITGR